MLIIKEIISTSVYFSSSTELMLNVAPDVTQEGLRRFLFQLSRQDLECHSFSEHHRDSNGAT